MQCRKDLITLASRTSQCLRSRKWVRRHLSSLLVWPLQETKMFKAPWKIHQVWTLCEADTNHLALKWGLNWIWLMNNGFKKLKKCNRKVQSKRSSKDRERSRCSKKSKMSSWSRCRWRRMLRERLSKMIVNFSMILASSQVTFSTITMIKWKESESHSEIKLVMSQIN